jgi:two-component sensor histidine kinase
MLLFKVLRWIGIGVSPNEKRLRAAVRAAEPAVWDWDAKSRKFLASKGLRALYGVNLTAPFGLDEFISHIHSEDRNPWQELFDGRDTSGSWRRILYRVASGKADVVRWLNADINRVIGIDGSVSYTGTVRDVSSERALTETEERLHLAMEAGRLAIYEIDLSSGRLTSSAELNLLLGWPIDAQPTLADMRERYLPGQLQRLEKEGVLYENMRDRVVDGAAAVKQDRAAFPKTNRVQVQAEVSIVTPAGRIKHLDYRAQHVPAGDGGVGRLVGVLVDVTDQKIAQDRLLLVAEELHHRLKNTLAIVHSMASQTFRSGKWPETALPAFLGRLRALAAATDAMLQANADDILLKGVVQKIIEPYRLPGSDPFILTGEQIRVSGKLATSIAMALHELSTNAVKYGALSEPGGRVSLAWHVSGNSVLELRWEELGGPRVMPPGKSGFGSKLLSTLIGHGSVTQHFFPDGLICVIKCPFEPVQETKGDIGSALRCRADKSTDREEVGELNS